MTNAQLAQAKQIAESDKSLLEVDHSVLFGLYLPDFKQVTVDILPVARLLREQALFLNGEWDNTALNEFAGIARHRIIVL